MAPTIVTTKMATRRQMTKQQAPIQNRKNTTLREMAAAETVLATAQQRMNCREMVEAKGKQRPWSRPGGKSWIFRSPLRCVRSSDGDMAWWCCDRPGEAAVSGSARA